MIALELQYVYLLIVSNALVLVAVCFSLARFENRCKQIDAFWASPTGSALLDEKNENSRQQLQITQQLEQRLDELQRIVKLTQIRKVRQPPPAERHLPIENAVRMAKRGASIDDLTKSCGLNIGEARLMQKLHGRTQLQAVGKQ